MLIAHQHTSRTHTHTYRKTDPDPDPQHIHIYIRRITPVIHAHPCTRMRGGPITMRNIIGKRRRCRRGRKVDYTARCPAGGWVANVPGPGHSVEMVIVRAHREHNRRTHYANVCCAMYTKLCIYCIHANTYPQDESTNPPYPELRHFPRARTSRARVRIFNATRQRVGVEAPNHNFHSFTQL